MSKERLEEINKMKRTRIDCEWVTEVSESVLKILLEQNNRYREAIDYVMKTDPGHYSNMYELIEDVKFVINKTLEGDRDA